MDADLVLEGGGVKGIALVGAVAVLEERGYRFHRVAGTSAGAIVGSLVAAGTPSAELAEIMRTLDYRAFRDAGRLDRLGWLGKAASLLVDHGVYEGSYLKRWLGERLAERGVRRFDDLRLDDPDSSLPPDQDFRLVVMASDLSYGRLRRLPWDYGSYGLDPGGIPVADAVRASMSIPFFYEPVRLSSSRHRETCWLVDGGMLSNFPVGTFDRRDGRIPRWPTFGIKLSARAAALPAMARRVHGTLGMARAMISTWTDFHDQIHLDDPSVVARTIFVDTLQVSATDFDIDQVTQQALYDSGRHAAERFLDGGDGQPPWDFAAYLERYRTGPDSHPPVAA